MVDKILLVLSILSVLFFNSSPVSWAKDPNGTWNIAVLMVDFSDKPGTATPSYFNSLLFGNHPSNAPNGSFKDYYTEVSYGMLTVTGQVNNGTVNWYRMPHPYSYYLVNYNLLIDDAVQVARTAGFNFGPFDTDNDGYVDGIFIIHSGTGQEFSGCTCDIWSFASVAYSDTGATNSLGNPVSVGWYAVVPEWYSTPGYDTIGIFAHEFGHQMGLPDLYDGDYTSRGLGRWSLMAVGSWNGVSGNRPAHLDAWSKVALRWVNPVVPTTAINLNLPPVETNPSIYKLYTTSREYFLLENRRGTGFDAALPGSGLLIYHVDDFITTGNLQEWYPGCSTCTSHYRVALVQADNQWHLERNINSGDFGDPYPGTSNKTAFNSTSSPSSSTYLNTSSGISITGISRPSDNIVANIGTPPIPKFDFSVTQALKLQAFPRVAFDGSNYLVVWNDMRNNTNQVYASRISPSGIVLDPAGIFIANGQFNDLIFDGINYLVIWGQSGNLFATLVSTTGTVLDSSGIPILTGGTGYSARLAFDGTNSMVVWSDSRSGTQDIYGARISSTGVVLNPGGIPLITGPGDQSLPVIAYGGGNYFLIWGDVQQASLKGSRLTPDGTLLDLPGIVLSTGISFPEGIGSIGTVVYQISSFLTLWVDGSYGSYVRGIRVNNSGTILDSTPIVISSSYGGIAPAAAFDGANAIVVWRTTDEIINGILVAPSGTLLSPNPFMLNTTASPGATAPAVATGQEAGLVVWMDLRNEHSNPTCRYPNCNYDIYANFYYKKLINISTRSLVQTGNNVMIGGFYVDGTTPKTVLIRARGPSMESAPFNVPGTLSNPTMQLYSGSTVIAQNNDWQTTDLLCGSPAVSCGNAAQITAIGLDPCQPNPGQTTPPPGCAQESAILITLPPGGYTAIVGGVGGTTGVGLIEVFEVQ